MREFRGDGVFRAWRFFISLQNLGPSPRGASTFRGGSAPNYLYTRPRARKRDHSIWCCAWMIGSVQKRVKLQRRGAASTVWGDGLAKGVFLLLNPETLHIKKTT
jgi:hypothetical protein